MRNSLFLHLIIISLNFLSIQPALKAQIGIGTATPHSSAILDVSSTTRGFLLPRMNFSQRTAISFPATGLMLFQSDNGSGFYFNAGTPGLPDWAQLMTTANSPWVVTGNHLYNANSGNIGIGTANPSALLSVGANSEFQIDNTGNIRRINNVAYTFPATQGSAGQFLTNNGGGNLSWNFPSITTSLLLSGNGTPVNPLTIASPGQNYRSLRTDGGSNVSWAVWGGYSVSMLGGFSNAATTPWDLIDFSAAQFAQNCISCQVLVRFYSPVSRVLYVRMPGDPNPVENVYDIAAGRSVIVGVGALNAKFEYYSNVAGQLKYEFLGFFQ